MYLRLEVPGRVVTGNASFRMTNTGKRYTSPEAAAYKKRVNDIAYAAVKSQGWPMKYDGLVHVTVGVYNSRGDLDGCMKVLFDGLQGMAYDNDSLIAGIDAYKAKDKKGPRVEVIVRKM